MNLLFFCLIILKFSVYEIPSSFRTSSFADEKILLQYLNVVRMVGEPYRSAGCTISFCNNWQVVLRCNAPISLSFCFLYVQRSEAPSENHAGDFNVSSQVLQISTFFFHSCIVWFWFMCITIMLHMIPIRKYPYKDSLYISRHTFMSFNEDSNAEYPLSIVI